MFRSQIPTVALIFYQTDRPTPRSLATQDACLFETWLMGRTTLDLDAIANR